MIKEDRTRHFVHLLYETLDLANAGLILTNMAELLIKGTAELSYK